jgi:hypothetical protein
MKRDAKSAQAAQAKIEAINSEAARKARKPVALHIQTILVSGAHINTRSETVYSAVFADGEIVEISKDTFDKEGKRLKRYYRGHLEKGGGRHSFYGTDVTEVLSLAS